MRADLIGPSYTVNSMGAILLESKEKMKKRGIASPDVADALAITFAYPVARKPEHNKPLIERNRARLALVGGSSWMG